MRRAVAYGVSGAANTTVTYLLYLALLPFVDYRAAIVGCYAVGIALAYFLNRFFVFRKFGHLGRFVGAYLVLLCANLALTSTMVELFGMRKAIAQLLAVAAVFVLGYFVNRTFIFRYERIEEAAKSSSLPPAA